jgi:hypothetical protein
VSGDRRLDPVWARDRGEILGMPDGFGEMRVTC